MNESRLPLREGVLLGATVLHRPSTSVAIPSRDPGHGTVTHSRCRMFHGIIYDREWIEAHWPNLSMCQRCAGA